MCPKHLSLAILLLLAVVSAGILRADDQPSTNETRLRDALRTTMLQLRDAQNQAVTLQAAQAQSDKDNADLKAKVDELTTQISTITKQSADDKAASDKAISDLKDQVKDLTGQIARLNDGLKQWKDAYTQAAQLAAAKEAERAKLAGQAIVLQRTIDDRESKNFALYKIANEILVRYEHYGLGDALSAKEPFVGMTRVKLENLVQEYKNKILDQAITYGQPPPAAPPAPASSGKAAGSPAVEQRSASSGKKPAKT